jgi:hypothetical protein
MQILVGFVRAVVLWKGLKAALAIRRWRRKRKQPQVSIAPPREVVPANVRVAEAPLTTRSRLVFALFTFLILVGIILATKTRSDRVFPGQEAVESSIGPPANAATPVPAPIDHLVDVPKQGR